MLWAQLRADWVEADRWAKKFGAVRELRQGETILVHPSALLFKDPYVGMQLHFEYPHGYTGMNFGALFGSSSAPIVPWLRMWGPGRVAVQSVFTESHEYLYSVSAGSPATEWRWA